jgi:hypothetical protein
MDRSVAREITGFASTAGLYRMSNHTAIPPVGPAAQRDMLQNDLCVQGLMRSGYGLRCESQGRRRPLVRARSLIPFFYPPER